MSMISSLEYLQKAVNLLKEKCYYLFECQVQLSVTCKTIGFKFLRLVFSQLFQYCLFLFLKQFDLFEKSIFKNIFLK